MAQRGFVKNLPAVHSGIDLFIKRVGDMYVATYREVVWSIFLEILNQTPQFSGRAVANWRIGIDAPELIADSFLGDDIDTGPAAFGNLEVAHQRGDRKWIDYAISVNEYKIPLIQRTSKVYITNVVRGDSDNGKSSEMYLEALQEQGYWMTKLREVNKPYETAQESIFKMAAQIGLSHGYEFKAGGASMR